MDMLFRALEPSDVELLYDWENDKSIWKLSNTIVPFSRFLLEQYVVNSHQDIFTAKQLRLMIDVSDNENNYKTIGCIDLFDFDPINMRAGVGILIEKNNRGKGFASKALKNLIEYAFDVLNLHQLYCNITVENINSIELFKKFNFEIIGLKKQWRKTKDLWIDEYMLQLIDG
ncbi:MAG: GNAT family N-acetyltransferase [Bacteroidales bacterium]|nr:GNAT family N-acetyltransferase [Bacteroidales bacterium]